MNISGMSPPKWFWAVGILALFWNVIGITTFLSELSLSAHEIKNLTEEHQYLYKSRPIWVKVSYALAVFSGLAGSIAILIRKKVAKSLLLLSLIGILGLVLYTFVLSDALNMLGFSNLQMPIFILIIGGLLFFYARYADYKGWLK